MGTSVYARAACLYYYVSPGSRPLTGFDPSTIDRFWDDRRKRSVRESGCSWCDHTFAVSGGVILKFVKPRSVGEFHVAQDGLETWVRQRFLKLEVSTLSQNRTS